MNKNQVKELMEFVELIKKAPDQIGDEYLSALKGFTEALLICKEKVTKYPETPWRIRMRFRVERVRDNENKGGKYNA